MEINKRNYYFFHLISNIPSVDSCEFIIFDKDLVQFHNELADAAISSATLYYDHYSEYFNLADYPDIWYQFDEDETIYANELRDKKEYDEESITWNIIKRRIEKQKILLREGNSGFKGIKHWLDLYTFYMDCGLIAAYDRPYLSIIIGDIDTFPKYLLQHILNRIQPYDNSNYLSQFKPFMKEIEKLNQTFNDDTITKNDLIIGMFLEILYLYQSVTENE